MSAPASCGLARRLVAAFYDGIVVIAVLFFAALPVVLLHGSAVEGSFLFDIYLLGVAFAFYGGFWTHGGQTIGMRAWGVRVVRADGGPVRWTEAGLRFTAAILSWVALGAGFWWCLLDRERLAWHDRLSGTRLVRTP